MPRLLKRGNLRWEGSFEYYEADKRKRFTKCFSTEEEALSWEVPLIEAAAKKRAEEKTRIKNSKTPEQRRKENLEKHGNDYQTEAIATIKFCKLLKDKYDFLQIRDNLITI